MNRSFERHRILSLCQNADFPHQRHLIVGSFEKKIQDLAGDRVQDVGIAGLRVVEKGVRIEGPPDETVRFRELPNCRCVKHPKK